MITQLDCSLHFDAASLLGKRRPFSYYYRRLYAGLFAIINRIEIDLIRCITYYIVLYYGTVNFTVQMNN